MLHLGMLLNLFTLLLLKFCQGTYSSDFWSCAIEFCSSDSTSFSNASFDESSSFISIWELTEDSDLSISLPLYDGGEYNFRVDWGDLSNSTIIYSFDQIDVTHMYNQTGNYTVVINGTVNGFRFNSEGDNDKLKQISKWGNVKLGNLGEYFAGCSNLDITAIDTPDLSDTSNLAGMFRDALSLTFENGEIESWNVRTFYSIFCYLIFYINYNFVI